MVWEAFKATCRGWCISYGTAKPRVRNQRKNKLMLELKNLEMQHMRDPNDQKLKTTVLLTRTELQSIIHEETSTALYKLRRKYFESGDKAGRMLALRLKQIESNSSITAIYDHNGSLVCERKEINLAFQEYYSKLYESECRYNPDMTDDFLRSAPLPQLNEDNKTYLEKDIQEMEVKAAIKALTAGKAPGQDGFSVSRKFYLHF